MAHRLLLIAAFCVASAVAQTPAPAPPPPDASPRQTRAYTLPPDKLQQAIDYARARNILHFVDAGWGIAVLIGVLALRVAPRLRHWTEIAARSRLAQAFVFSSVLLLLVDVLALPLSVYRQHLARVYGQSVQGWGSWLRDWATGEGIQFVIAGFLVWILYGVIRRSPRRWWFYFWLATIPIILFLQFITPVLIEPLFFKFEPLAARNPALVAEIEKVVARGGLSIPPGRMFEMNASEKLNSLNAYVAGIGASKRVVVWDTTIRKMTTGEILFVFGHEMGHYVLGHMWLGIGAACLGALVFLFLASRAMRWALARWGERWSIRSLDDWASLPVLMLAVALFGFFSEPVSNSFSRVLEHDADIYGLEVIHGIVPNASDVAARSFQILGEVALADPDPSPFIQFWRYDHPSVADRVRFVSAYDPWSAGREPKYVRR